MRVNVTAVAGSAFAFFETKTRPVLVAAHRVEASLRARTTAATVPPVRDPYAGAFNFPSSPGLPSFTQSPHVTLAGKVPVHSLQKSRSCCIVSEPTPCVFVRHTCWVPTYIVPLTAGSEGIGT